MTGVTKITRDRPFSIMLAFFSAFFGKTSIFLRFFLTVIQISAAERVFSILKASFNEQQDCALVDYIQASVMAQYNKR